MLAALTEAQQTGARLRAACAVIGISARTVARWQRRPNVADGRRGPRRRPANALTPAEAAQVLTVMTSARYGHLSPKQLVPRLADAGVNPLGHQQVAQPVPHPGALDDRLMRARERREVGGD